MVLGGKDAQIEFVAYKAAKNTAADWVLDKNNKLLARENKWDGILKIENEPNLTSINLTGNLIDELIIIGCPKLTDIDISDNEFIKVDVSKLKTDASGGAVANGLETFNANDNPPLEDVNLENCKSLNEIFFNNCGDIKKLQGGMDFSDSLHSINFQGTTGLHFGGTTELKEWKSAKDVVSVILGKDLPTKEVQDPAYPTDPSKKITIVDVDATKSQVITKSSEDPSSPTKNDLDAIKSALDLAVNASRDDILEAIQKLKDAGSGNNYISKISLKSIAKSNLKGLGITEGDIDKKLGAAASAREVEDFSNELINNRFDKLQSKLNTAHYLNAGLGTFSVLITLILVWMVLKDRKLLPSQEEEEQKD
jgi:hypothetical protein